MDLLPFIQIRKIKSFFLEEGQLKYQSFSLKCEGNTPPFLYMEWQNLNPDSYSLTSVQGAVVAKWLSSLLAEQEVRGSIPHLATWISEIGYLLLPSRDTAALPIKRRKSSIQPTSVHTEDVNFVS